MSPPRPAPGWPAKDQEYSSCLADTPLLEIGEALVAAEGTLTRLSYCSHGPDASGPSILRNDDTPHHAASETFPRHTEVEDTVVPSQRPALSKRLADMQRLSPQY